MVAHLIVTVSFLAAIKFLEIIVHFLWGADKIFLGVVPLSYLLDLGDVITLLCLAIYGFLGLIVKFWSGSGKSNEQDLH